MLRGDHLSPLFSQDLADVSDADFFGTDGKPGFMGKWVQQAQQQAREEQLGALGRRRRAAPTA